MGPPGVATRSGFMNTKLRTDFQTSGLPFAFTSRFPNASLFKDNACKNSIKIFNELLEAFRTPVVYPYPYLGKGEAYL